MVAILMIQRASPETSNAYLDFWTSACQVIDDWVAAWIRLGGRLRVRRRLSSGDHEGRFT
ncbi:MAG: hypothetical protein H6Q33_2527 [Deltaproteobacteria bacterium]|jgi:hypothetical protein|nr:hypothetical protein [Deltaproteobacteria bacterium]